MEQRQAKQAMSAMIGRGSLFRLPVMAENHEAAYGADLDAVGIERSSSRWRQRGTKDLNRQENQGNTGR